MYTKEMADQNRQMEARARELYPDKGNGLIIQIIQSEFPEVATGRIKRMVDKVARMKTLRQWGGKRPNQTGRPPLLEEDKRDRVSIRLGPGYKEKAEACAQALGVKGGGLAIEEALDRLAKDLGLK